MLAMPSQNTILLANFMATKLVPLGYKVGTAEPNSIVIYLPEADQLSSQQDFTDFIAVFLKQNDLKLKEKTEFHFYKDVWLGGVVFEPRQ